LFPDTRQVSEVLVLVGAVVSVRVAGFGEDELCDPGAAFEFDGVVDLEQSLAAPLVAGVPDGRIQHTGVAKQRRPRVEEPDVSLGDRDPLGVPHDVPAGVEAVQAVGGVEFAAVADSLVPALDAPRRRLFVDRPEREVDAVGLDLLRAEAVELCGDELAALEHARGSAAAAKTLPESGPPQSRSDRPARPVAGCETNGPVFCHPELNLRVMDEKRLAVLGFGVAVALAAALLAYRFIAAFTVAVFLYYATRWYYKLLAKLRLPARIRAVVVVASLALPLVLLISYTVAILAIEARRLIDQYPVIDVASENLEWFGGIDEVPELTVQGVYQAYRAGELDVFVTFATENATFLTSLVSGFFLNLFIVVVVTYYLLVDGARIREWLLRFDDDAIIREYLEAVDEELETVLRGNLLNVIVTAFIAIAVFQGYNAVAPAAAEVPYPTLAGALTGIASLIPVIGMKIVYLPLAGIAAVPIALGADQSLFVYIVGFLVLSVVVVDTIPDLILRPLLSGDATHVGLLMLAYTLGPVVLGFYGLFFAPIVLVVALTFAQTALPRLLGVEPADDGDGLHRDQLRLDDF